MFKLCADKFGPFFSFDVPHIGKTHRTTASIKALGAVAPSLICRNVYYAGAKHLLPILELLLPGIDLVSYLDISRLHCIFADYVYVKE